MIALYCNTEWEKNIQHFIENLKELNFKPDFIIGIPFSSSDKLKVYADIK
jgi:hypothetical protein